MWKKKFKIMLLICKFRRWIRSQNQLKQWVREGPSRMVLAKCLAVVKSLVFHTERVKRASVEEDTIYICNIPF